jgi:HAD superfamily hydrolase (TIGR01509 family)
MEAHGTSSPMLGAYGLLRRAREAGWAIAIVTSARREGALAWLGAHRLLNLVDLVVGSDDVCKGKPDPEPYRLAIERLGCSADLSCAVEDSAQGSTAALGAGLRTFVLGADPVRWRGPDGVDFIKGLAEIGAEFR